MPFRPNYRQARGERDRAKQQKKQEKARKRDEDAARRKAEHEPDENIAGLPGDDAAAPGDGGAPEGHEAVLP
jgi:hypothetical protein